MDDDAVKRAMERIADLVHVGVRQLTRLFLKETGETPAKAVERMRAELAHAQLTGTSASIEVIARRVGFENAERMRRAFMKLYGNSPQAVRRTAGREGAGAEAAAALSRARRPAMQ